MSFVELIDKHSATLKAAVEANAARQYFAHWNESPSKKVYGETAAEEGEAAFKALLHHKFTRLLQTNEISWHGEEESPFGFPLGIHYPLFAVEHLMTKAHNAKMQWQTLSPLERACILIETLEQAGTGKTFFEIAHATMHTSGQSFAMSFQASGPHSFDRALEAIALGYREQAQFAEETTWTKPVGAATITVKKHFHIVPKGVGLVIGCSTFPVWNTLPGLFASLVTGNPVIVKPHPKSVLAIAIVVASMQQTLRDRGIDPHLVQLAPDSSANPLTLELAEHPAVGIIDFTGGAFGDTLENIGRSHGKAVFTEKAGVNGVILESVDNLDAVLDNLAFTLSLYSGQMCTTSQNFFINKHGVREGSAVIPFDDVAQRLAQKIDALMQDPKMSGIAGSIQNATTLDRIQKARELGLEIIRDSQPVVHSGFPHARTASPLLLKARVEDHDIYEREWFGPISFLIPTDGFDHSLHLLLRSLRRKGALTTLVYTIDKAQREQAEHAIIFEGKAPVAFNYVGGIFVNQSSAFSDFHGAGANPAGTASFTDAAFVASRFNMIGAREVVR
ncbi:MAG: phenylacetic acid degradation protein PaaN [Bacteroidota bacterium]|nr:phenylacetic acid degradation protein PaaN [Candidatus Kapabacteria bacterium]MDW8219070.1 phenylacetic acid degradation protein PaaN [Bacteroidota bacterium]